MPGAAMRRRHLLCHASFTAEASLSSSIHLLTGRHIHNCQPLFGPRFKYGALPVPTPVTLNLLPSTLKRLKMKPLALLTIFLFLSTLLTAQDIIVKNDKTEIKAKVLEIQEAEIKYKRFDFLDGPVYSIPKQSVFIILYENGRRESFSTQDPVPRATSDTRTPVQPSSGASLSALVNEDPGPGTTAPAPAARPLTGYAGYGKVGRVIVNIPKTDAYSSGFNAGFSYDFLSLIKNYVNMGIKMADGSVNGKYNDGSLETHASTLSLGAYINGYLPVSLLASKGDQGEKGFFPFLQIGFAWSRINGYTLSYSPYAKQNTSAHATDFDFTPGVDYFFSKSFGLSLSFPRFKSLWWGIALKY